MKGTTTTRGKPISAKHKKDDDNDEESKSRNYVEKTLEKENSDKVNILLQNVSALKQISSGIGSHLKEEKVLLGQLDEDFAKNNLTVKKVMGRIDDLF